MTLAVCVRTELYGATLWVLEMKTVSLRLYVWPTWGPRIRFLFLSKSRFLCFLFLSVHVSRVTRLFALTPLTILHHLLIYTL